MGQAPPLSAACDASTGFFQLPSVPPGTHSIEIRHVGSGSLQTRYVQVPVRAHATSGVGTVVLRPFNVGPVVQPPLVPPPAPPKP